MSARSPCHHAAPVFGACSRAAAVFPIQGVAASKACSTSGGNACPRPIFDFTTMTTLCTAAAHIAATAPKTPIQVSLNSHCNPASPELKNAGTSPRIAAASAPTTVARSTPSSTKGKSMDTKNANELAGAARIACSRCARLSAVVKKARKLRKRVGNASQAGKEGSGGPAVSDSAPERSTPHPIRYCQWLLRRPTPTQPETPAKLNSPCRTMWP
mmetsp:Transcript_120057/g.233841  ORF Transcript_120057/g.233841 Transcript_120057/m.233841 type:complete len:214 (+) Transcript_120057:2968-3609(+)